MGLIWQGWWMAKSAARHARRFDSPSQKVSREAKRLPVGVLLVSGTVAAKDCIGLCSVLSGLGREGFTTPEVAANGGNFSSGTGESKSGDTSGVEAEAKTVAALTATGLAATTAFRCDRDGDTDASTAACLVASKHYDRIRFWAVFS